MGILRRRLKGKAASGDGETTERFIVAFSESVVAEMPYHAQLLDIFPDIPPNHLRVLTCFVALSLRERGTLDEHRLRQEMAIACGMYLGRHIEVRRAGSEWQVWQFGEFPS